MLMSDFKDCIRQRGGIRQTSSLHVLKGCSGKCFIFVIRIVFYPCLPLCVLMSPCLLTVDHSREKISHLPY